MDSLEVAATARRTHQEYESERRQILRRFEKSVYNFNRLFPHPVDENGQLKANSAAEMGQIVRTLYDNLLNCVLKHPAEATGSSRHSARQDVFSASLREIWARLEMLDCDAESHMWVTVLRPQFEQRLIESVLLSDSPTTRQAKTASAANSRSRAGRKPTMIRTIARCAVQQAIASGCSATVEIIHALDRAVIGQKKVLTPVWAWDRTQKPARMRTWEEAYAIPQLRKRISDEITELRKKEKSTSNTA